MDHAKLDAVLKRCDSIASSRKDAEFNESDHPRAEDGKFGSGVAGARIRNTGGAKALEVKAAKPADKESGKVTHLRGVMKNLGVNDKSITKSVGRNSFGGDLDVYGRDVPGSDAHAHLVKAVTSQGFKEHSRSESLNGQKPTINFRHPEGHNATIHGDAYWAGANLGTELKP